MIKVNPFTKSHASLDMLMYSCNVKKVSLTRYLVIPPGRSLFCIVMWLFVDPASGRYNTYFLGMVQCCPHQEIHPKKFHADISAVHVDKVHLQSGCRRSAMLRCNKSEHSILRPRQQWQLFMILGALES